MTMSSLRHTLLALLVVLSGCAASSTDDTPIEESEDPLRTAYGDLLSTLEGPDLDRWVAVRSSLAAGFDRLCGDTICSGDFANLRTVRIACSSTTLARKMKDCAWILGGSIERVDPALGTLTSDARAFTCKIPVAGTAKRMLDTLERAGESALTTPLPATGKSFYDGLVACFAGVSGAPIPPPQTAPVYAELGQHWSETAEPRAAAWRATGRRLDEGFDRICGDTFCEGEFPDITPLRFACALELASDKVPRCSWTFAAAELSVGARGQIEARTETKRCEVEIGADAAALEGALSGDAPLSAPLPGKATSIYDALIGCL